MISIAALLATSSLAQAPDGPYWSSTPLPAGFQSVTNIGTTGTIKATGSVTFFSSILRTYTTVPISLAAIVSSFNDYGMIKDGNTVTAYCSRTGAASTLNVSPSAVLTNGPATSTWTSVVVDGTQAFGYGAFVGTWTPLALAAPNPTVAAGNNCLLLYDGTQLHALSSLTSTWTSITPAEPIVGLGAGGFVGLAWGATTVYGFSNHHQQWTSFPFAAQNAPTFKDNYAWFSNGGTSFLFYSAITDGYAQHSTAASTIPLAGQNCAIVSDAVSTVLYASPKGVFVPSPIVGINFYFNSEWAIVDDGLVMHAFSGVTGAFAAPLPGTFTVAGNEDVVFATSGSGSYAYSPLQNAWTAAPSGTPTSVQYIRNGVILVQPTGYDGFCTRTGTWSSITTTVVNQFQTLSSSATFCAIDGNSMSVFDSRLGRWATIATQAPPTISIWRFTLVANDGVNGYGFGMTSNVWETLALPGPPVQMVANDSVGFIRTNTHIHFFCALGSLSTVSRYPEFSRMQARGSLLRLMQIGPGGSLVTVGVSAAGDYFQVPPFGIGFISLASFVGLVDLGSIPGNGVLDLSILLPNDPALSNVPVYLQDIIVPPAGSPYLTNSMSPIII